MTDVFDTEKRSAVIGRVKSRDTAPELRVGSRRHVLCLRFRLARRIARRVGKPRQA